MISLSQVTSYPDARRYIEAFADDPRNVDFFRRIGPKFTWCNDASIQQMFGTSYFIRKDEEVVGLVSIVQFDEQTRKVEFGLLASKLKYAKDALQQLSEYVFDYLNYNKLWCRILSSRKKDLGLFLSMAGFKKEGLLRDECFMHGKYRDELVYGKIRKDWK